MKRSVILILAFVVLIGWYWLLQSKRHVVPANRPFVTCDSAAVTLLRVETATDTVELMKEGDNWTLVRPLRYPAASRSVASAVGRFGQMQKLSMVTDRVERAAEFQTDDASGTKVTVGQGKKQQTFYLGKAGPTASTSYARLDGSNEVWEIAGNHGSTFKRKAKDWRDKTITELNQADIRKIALVYPDHTITLALEDTTWKVDAGARKFDGEKGLVDRLTGLLSRMSSVDFADTLAANAFDKPDLHLTAEMADGSKIDLKLIPKDEKAEQYFLRKAGASSDFVIYKSTANVLMKKAEDFLSKPES